MFLFKRSPILTVRAESFSGIDCTKKSGSDISCAGYMKNWRITDDGKLTKRGGYECLYNITDSDPLFVGMLNADEFFVYKKGTCVYSVRLSDGNMIVYDMNEDVKTGAFVFCGLLYIIGYECIAVFDGVRFSEPEPYIPTVAITASNEGGGVVFESLNLISPYARIMYSPNGNSGKFVLPDAAFGISSVVDGGRHVPASEYIFENSSKTLTLNHVPESGVANSLEVVFLVSSEYRVFPILYGKRFYLFGCGGDTRVFAYGNDNVIYYSDVTDTGSDPLYYPAENMIRIGDGSYAVTGLCRHYSNLTVFTERDAWYISPSSIEYDGYSRPTFPVFPLNGKIGCTDGGVILADNSPLSVCSSGVYLWSSSNVRDEKNARLISSPTEGLFDRAFFENAMVFDHESEGEAWIVNNGRILVYNYRRSAWYFYDGIYGDKFFEYDGQAYFVNATGLYCFTKGIYTDDGKAYFAVWESAFSDFGTHEKKDIRRLYASFIPQINSEAVITVIPNRGSGRALGYDGCFSLSIFSFDHISFPKFTFECEGRPKTVSKRLNLRGVDSAKLRIENNSTDSRCTVDTMILQMRL